MSMLQEKTEWVLGLQLCRKSAQLTWYNRTMKEPVTLGTGSEDENYLLDLPDGVWDCLCSEAADPEPARDFFAKCIEKITGLREADRLQVMVTVPKLQKVLGERIPEILQLTGVQRKDIYLQDYKSSFFYYTVNQKRELWNGDVALIEYENETMRSAVLHIDRSTRPAMVTIEEAASQSLNEKTRDGRNDEDWDRERDRLFFELLKKTFERRTVVTSYLIGEYFDKSWAQKSFQYLCFHRHAFQGDNLYTRGACYGAMTRAGMIASQELLFMGSDIIHDNIGMMMRVRGKEIYYPIISAGVNWYEAHHVCEFIPDGERTITLLTRTMTGGDEIRRKLRLTGLPKRPNRATRLKMTVYFVSADCCVVEVEDLGFGGFYRATGMKWKRNIYL